MYKLGEKYVWGIQAVPAKSQTSIISHVHESLFATDYNNNQVAYPEPPSTDT